MFPVVVIIIGAGGGGGGRISLVPFCLLKAWVKRSIGDKYHGGDFVILNIVVFLFSCARGTLLCVPCQVYRLGLLGGVR